tara:strand:+ start:52 stop:213 length:162 start_codon:yes stop_codon:yes gene_type:complete
MSIEVKLSIDLTYQNITSYERCKEDQKYYIFQWKDGSTLKVRVKDVYYIKTNK